MILKILVWWINFRSNEVVKFSRIACDFEEVFGSEKITIYLKLKFSFKLNPEMFCFHVAHLVCVHMLPTSQRHHHIPKIMILTKEQIKKPIISPCQRRKSQVPSCKLRIHTRQYLGQTLIYQLPFHKQLYRCPHSLYRSNNPTYRILKLPKLFVLIGLHQRL